MTHGGNNSVTEAIGSGVPLVVLPFSTDQFAGAAAVERSGFGVALEPNAASVDELASAIAHVLALDPDRGRGWTPRRPVRPRRQDRNWRSPRSLLSLGDEHGHRRGVAGGIPVALHEPAFRSYWSPARVSTAWFSAYTRPSCRCGGAPSSVSWARYQATSSNPQPRNRAS